MALVKANKRYIIDNARAICRRVVKDCLTRALTRTVSVGPGVYPLSAPKERCSFVVKRSGVAG